MNTKQMKAMKWHKKCMVDAMRAEGIILYEIDETLDAMIDLIDETRVRPEDKARADGYAAGFIDGEFIGYNNGWEGARMKYSVK